MKTRIPLIIASFAFVIASSIATPAAAEVDRGKLIGYWNGDLVVFFHGNAKGMQIEVNFQKNGKFTLKQLKNGKTDEAKFVIKGDRILITDGKGKDTYITDIALTDDKLRGRFESSEQADDQMLSIELALRRGRAQVNSDDKAAPEKKK